VEAVLKFRQQGDHTVLPLIVNGIIERYLPPESSEKFNHSNPATRLAEDIGIDSLTMLEIVLLMEDAFGFKVEDSELREIKTMGDINAYISAKVSGAPVPKPKRRLGSFEIKAILPQQPPFLFVDRAELTDEGAQASYTIRGDEAFLEGHFKDNPVFPASLAFEALGQVACLWVLETMTRTHEIALKSNQVFFASMDGAHFYRQCRPGDTLEMEIKMTKVRAPLALFEGFGKVNGEKAFKIEQLILAFGEKADAASSPTATPTVEPLQVPVAA
jgi:3-hydroxyacyl-[acyl-carrier-protein] dehydratase